MKTCARDLTAAVLASAGLIVAGYISTTSVIVFAQSSDPIGSISPLAEFAVRQGGALLVLLVVLFFFRRDYRYLSEYRDQQFQQSLAVQQILVKLVEENTKAQTDNAAAIRENTVVVHQAKLVIRDRMPRSGDG